MAHFLTYDIAKSEHRSNFISGYSAAVLFTSTTQPCTQQTPLPFHSHDSVFSRWKS